MDRAVWGICTVAAFAVLVLLVKGRLQAPWTSSQHLPTGLSSPIYIQLHNQAQSLMELNGRSLNGMISPRATWCAGGGKWSLYTIHRSGAYYSQQCISLGPWASVVGNGAWPHLFPPLSAWCILWKEEGLSILRDCCCDLPLHTFRSHAFMQRQITVWLTVFFSVQFVSVLGFLHHEALWVTNFPSDIKPWAHWSLLNTPFRRQKNSHSCIQILRKGL